MNEKVDIEAFRVFVINQFPPGDCIPLPPTGLTEIFAAITRHGLWNYFHYSPLVYIIEKFAANDTEMKGWVQSYEKDLKAYQLVTTVEEHIDVDLCTADPHPAKYNTNYYCPVEWKTKFIDHSLHYLAEVWKLFSGRYLVPDSPPTALLDHICKGCFVVTWLVPSHLIPSLIKNIVDTDFLKQHQILRVTAGDQCVYEEVTEENSSVS